MFHRPLHKPGTFPVSAKVPKVFFQRWGALSPIGGGILWYTLPQSAGSLTAKAACRRVVRDSIAAIAPTQAFSPSFSPVPPTSPVFTADHSNEPGMMDRSDVTRILENAAAGHPSASEELLPLVYDELRKLAQGYMMQERPDHTLQATALANEVCVRLLGAHEISWQSRAHFFAVASRAMRRVLANHARDRNAAKRAPLGERITLEHLAAGPSTVDLVALDDTLTRLSSLNAEHASLVELRVFGGLTVDEIALVLGRPKRTVERQWRAVQAWLALELAPDAGPPGTNA